MCNGSNCAFEKKASGDCNRPLTRACPFMQEEPEKEPELSLEQKAIKICGGFDKLIGIYQQRSENFPVNLIYYRDLTYQILDELRGGV